MAEDEYYGHKTMSDGSHVPFSSDEAKSLWDQMERRTAERAQRMPDARSALAMISSAKERLRELGWSDCIYCPKDGSKFAVCEVGSTGMWRAFYSGDWPNGYVNYGDCVTHPKGMFFKLMEKLDDAEKTLVAECDKSVGEWIERLGRSFGDMEQ